MNPVEDMHSDAADTQSTRLSARLVAAMFRRWLGQAQAGSMMLRLPDGSLLRVAGAAPGPAAQVNINSWKMAWRVATGGLLGVASSWRDGLWDTPDLQSVLDFGLANEKAMTALTDAPGLAQKIANFRHRLNANTRRGSRKNIAFHYDLGNEFYARWLDPTMTYSAALFSAPDQSLQTAQIAKYQRIVDELKIQSGDVVLEIGCGWGGFAEFAVRETGCRVVALTVSEAQAQWARTRIADANLSDRIEVRLQDYRDCTGAFDKIVSIEMFEAVGEANWPAYFSSVRALLKPDGAAMVQVITIEDTAFEKYQRSADFIQTYIFPGGMLPSPGRFETGAGASGLQIAGAFFFGRDYERTLLAWDQAFRDNWSHIAPLGFDEPFNRLWRFYLHYCAAGFRSGRIDVAQFRLTPAQ